MSTINYHDDNDENTYSQTSSKHEHKIVEPIILSPTTTSKLKYKKKEWSSSLFSAGDLSVKSNSKSETKYFVIQDNVEYDDENDEQSQHLNVDYDDDEENRSNSDSDTFTETDKLFQPKLQSTTNTTTSTQENNCKIYEARDFNETCYACCCLPCANADILKYAKNNQSSWWCTCCISCCFPTIMSTIVRNITRKLYGIQGNTCMDCCVGTFCSCCSSAQVLREIRCRGPPKSVQMI